MIVVNLVDAALGHGRRSLQWLRYARIGLTHRTACWKNDCIGFRAQRRLGTVLGPRTWNVGRNGNCASSLNQVVYKRVFADGVERFAGKLIEHSNAIGAL